MMTEKKNDKNARPAVRPPANRPPINQPAKREITAGLVVFRRTSEGPKFLLLYHRGSYWNFPKGHVEKEERSLEAAIRETTEETGLRRSDLRILPNFKTHERFFFRKEKETIFKIVIIFLAETREKNIRISDEHQGFGWFLFNEAKKILGKYRENQKILIQANDFINFKGRGRPALARSVAAEKSGAVSPAGRRQPAFGGARQRRPFGRLRHFAPRPPFAKR